MGTTSPSKQLKWEGTIKNDSITKKKLKGFLIEIENCFIRKPLPTILFCASGILYEKLNISLK